jgi:hypothetical protein
MPEPGADEAETRTAFDHGEPKSLAAPAELAPCDAQRQPAERDVYRKAAARLGACAAEAHRLQRMEKSPTSPLFFRL